MISAITYFAISIFFAILLVLASRKLADTISARVSFKNYPKVKLLISTTFCLVLFSVAFSQVITGILYGHVRRYVSVSVVEIHTDPQSFWLNFLSYLFCSIVFAFGSFFFTKRLLLKNHV